VYAQSGATVTVHGSVLEGCHASGLFLPEADATIDTCVIRGIQPETASNEYGYGVDFEPQTSTTHTLTMRHVLVEQTTTDGVLVASKATADLEDTFVRDTQPSPNEGVAFGVNVTSQQDYPYVPSATVHASLVEGNGTNGIQVLNGVLDLESSVVRGTLPHPDGSSGVGVAVITNPTLTGAASITIGGCLIERNHAAGIGFAGSTGVVQASVIRDTAIETSTQSLGLGMQVSLELQSKKPSKVQVHGCVLSGNSAAGILVTSSSLQMDGSVVKDSLAAPTGGGEGDGIDIEPDPNLSATEAGPMTTLDLSSSLVDGNGGVGVFAGSASMTLTSCIVRGTLASADGSFGDGVTAGLGASATVNASIIEGNARAGISTFGGAITLTSSAVQCNPIDLDGEVYQGQQYSFTASADVCGCGSGGGSCEVLSSGLGPPQPIAVPGG
jgi:hypothetical protein